MNMLLNEVSLDHSSTIIVSETITVPDSGYVLAFASATGSMDHTWGDNDDIEITISKTSVYLSPFNQARVRLPMNAGSGSYVFTLSPIATFFVESAGEYTYRVYGHRNGPAATEVDYARLTLLYVPTFYGTIYWESAVSDEETPSSALERIAPQDRPDSQSLDQLPAGMKTLVQDLVTAEVAKIRKDFETRITELEANARR